MCDVLCEAKVTPEICGLRLCSHCTGYVFAPLQKLLQYSVNKN